MMMIRSEVDNPDEGRILYTVKRTVMTALPHYIVHFSHRLLTSAKLEVLLFTDSPWKQKDKRSS